MALIVSKSGVPLSPKARDNRFIAILTKVEVRAVVTVVTDSMCNFSVARSTLLQKLRRRRVVNEIKHLWYFVGSVSMGEENSEQYFVPSMQEIKLNKKRDCIPSMYCTLPF